MGEADGPRVIFVVDWWEKLAGASLALTGMVQLCKASGMALVEPFVHSSMFRPFPQPESLPLDAYYELDPIRAAVRLVTYARWEAHAAATPPRQKTAVLLVWSDFPKECVSALPPAVGLSRCPAACVRRGRRQLYDRWERATSGWPLTCLRAEVLRRAMRKPSVQLFRRYRAVTLLNFRRHDDRHPMLPTSRLQQARGATVRPSRALRAAARAFVASRLGARYGEHAAVQLRSNHLAHAIHQREVRGAGSGASSARGGSCGGSGGGGGGGGGVGGGGGGCGANCSSRLRGCLRRLAHAARALAPPARTVAASDLATLFRTHQDGESHRRHAYVAQCLRPNAAMLLGGCLALTRSPPLGAFCKRLPACCAWPGPRAARSLRAARSQHVRAWARHIESTAYPWHPLAPLGTTRLVPRRRPCVQLQRCRLCRAARGHRSGHRAGWRRAVRRGGARATRPPACRPACFGSAGSVPSPARVYSSGPGSLLTPSTHPRRPSKPRGVYD